MSTLIAHTATADHDVITWNNQTTTCMNLQEATLTIRSRAK